ncbi:hypothetical protein N7456_010640 [Penicillium angulare]|uniref:Uncharacterized protein n=1 Tax=Penicillium angulare TaxID=116970 RepID=A0A9W9F709_9EURO|nr:hypothetical protein N7456_010640 [Penicillium angulare]
MKPWRAVSSEAEIRHQTITGHGERYNPLYYPHPLIIANFDFLKLPTPELQALSILPLAEVFNKNLTCVYFYNLIPRLSHEQILLVENTGWACQRWEGEHGPRDDPNIPAYGSMTAGVTKLIELGKASNLEPTGTPSFSK